MSQHLDRFFAFDLNITEACSLRCTYCCQDFSKKLKNLSPEMIQKVKDKIDFLLQDAKFLKYFDGVKIFFWGGEPTTQPQIIKDFLEYYKNNKRVNFYIYSNGFMLDKIFDILKEHQYFKDDKRRERVELQISYDGLASHDVARVDTRGKGSALRVKENMFKLHEKGIKFHIHPTISFENLHCIYDNWVEFKKLNQLLPDARISYSPTLDYLTDHSGMTKEQLNNYINIITNQIKKIAKKEIEHYKETGDFFFSWLRQNKALCGAGSALQAIDQNGDVVACHGALYVPDEARKELTLNNINKPNDEFVDLLINNHINFTDARQNKLPDECKNCYATYCMKCNVAKFHRSKENEYFDKWMDFPNQGYLCEVYRHVTKLRFMLLKIMKQK